MSALHGMADVVKGLSEYELFLLEAVLAQREVERGKPLPAAHKRELAADFVAARQEKKKSEQLSRRKAAGQRRVSVSEAHSRDFTWAPPTPRRKPSAR